MSRLIQAINDCLSNSSASTSLYNLLNAYSAQDLAELKEHFERQGYQIDETNLKDGLVSLMESLAE